MKALDEVAARPLQTVRIKEGKDVRRRLVEARKVVRASRRVESKRRGPRAAKSCDGDADDRGAGLSRLARRVREARRISGMPLNTTLRPSDAASIVPDRQTCSPLHR